jgi:Mrp family chromosome partitioning ATPase
LEKGRSADDLIPLDPESGVHLLAAGPRSPRPLDVLSSERFATAIERWRTSFDFILVDVPPLLATSDALVLVPNIDYCVFVVRWRKTAWEAINQGLRLLTEAKARIAGVAVSQVDPRYFAANGFPSAIYSRYFRSANAREA